MQMFPRILPKRTHNRNVFVFLDKLSPFMTKGGFKGILKLILVIFCISWKLAIGLINDIYETLTRFLSMKLCKNDIIRW
jgi:hypothetical protein